MTRVWTEGWEFRDLIGYCIGGGSVILPTISTGVKRSGAASMGVHTVSNPGFSWLYKTIDPALSECYLRFAVYLDPDPLSLRTPKIYFDTDSYITFGTCFNINLVINGVLVETGITTLYQNIWYLIEVHFVKSATVGSVEIKLDGMSSLEVDYSGNTGADPISQIKFDMAPGFLGEVSDAYFDDIAMNDISGGVDDSWCGEGKIIVMMPNDDSTPLELTPSAASDHHLLVDEVPTDSDTTYVEGSVVDEEDMYNLTPSGLVDVDINRVWTEARTRKTAAIDGHVALITKAAGGAEVSGGDVELLTTYTIKVLGAEELVNPVDSNPWEVADVDLIEIGPRTR